MAEIKVIEMELRKLIPYENNPRKNEKAVDAVMQSIKQFGFKNPIIVDENMVIISGHTRRLAALKLSMEKVPVIIAKDLSEEQVRALCGWMVENGLQRVPLHFSRYFPRP